MDHETIRKTPPGCGGLCISRPASVIVIIVHVPYVRSLKTEEHPPIVAYRHQTPARLPLS
jgi:hypothetical protein